MEGQCYLPCTHYLGEEGQLKGLNVNNPHEAPSRGLHTEKNVFPSFFLHKSPLYIWSSSLQDHPVLFVLVRHAKEQTDALKCCLIQGNLLIKNSWPFYQGPGWNLPCQFNLMGEKGKPRCKEEDCTVWPTLYWELLSWREWNGPCFILSSMQLTKLEYVKKAITFIKNKKSRHPFNVFQPLDTFFPLGNREIPE